MSSSSHSGKAHFRDFLKSQSPYLENVEQQDAVAHCDAAVQRLSNIGMLLASMKRNIGQPFRGITTDGSVRPNLFERADDDIHVDAIAFCGENILQALTEDQKPKVFFPLEAEERRLWQNTHLYFDISRFGIRLDETSDEVQSRVLKLLDSAMSPEGYQKAMLATKTNAFLGRLYKAPGVLNDFSYNFAMFGQPSTTDPWGWMLFGHHLCLNFFVYGNHIEITPTFSGAEPNEIDEGPLLGTKLYTPEQNLGLRFMQQLPSDLQVQALVNQDINSPEKGSMTWAVAAAFQDNRIIPYQGTRLASAVSPATRELLLEIVEQFVLYLPQQARRRKRAEVAKHFDDTYFAWVGDFDGDNAKFYYRIHSPVILCEFEHCPSIFLGNTKAERFHIHTHVRAPNGGDYGMALLDT
ncbi:Protein of unknown function (DUF3500) [Teratosphaeria destructans]|uniref:DUF3500 domain-containing protein n=1 Tax=Teratosphaeria destructans TaxID=418781 RepID=A0A9W7SMG7_9PEZI|nr:Protein of unknown function (DUF3500) [Teratosphaeria destructans]